MRLLPLALAVVVASTAAAQQRSTSPEPMSPPPIPLPANLPVLPAAQQTKMNHDLLEIDIEQLHRLYQQHKYTVEQVTRWYMGRIAQYNGIYRAVQTVNTAEALATAKTQDTAKYDAAKPLWGVPVVIKANTAVKGLIDSDGWQGFALPGHEFIAPKDATVVARLRAAGAIILGITNMPDFAASDTNRSTAFGRTGNAYDVRFSPGGSSGGTVTAVTSNMAMLGTGTDTANSIRMPSGTSAVVGVLPTRGLVSIAGIAPLDWLLDNTGPIARNVTDAAIALGVMNGSGHPVDPLDFRTEGTGRTEGADTAQLGPYLPYLKKDALKGKRFGIPAFMLSGNTGFGVSVAPRPTNAMRPETRAMLMKAIDQLRAAGAEIVIDDTFMPDTFAQAVRKINTRAYRRDGTNQWLAEFGPAEYRSVDAYEKAIGSPLPATVTGITPPGTAANPNRPPTPQVLLKEDPKADETYFGPRKAALALFLGELDRLHLDGVIYPSAQMPPPDETMPQNGQLSSGPHSSTGWNNNIGVPAVVVPAGFYDGGLPFGLEISTRPWHDGDLLGWAYAYEQSTKMRKSPVLVEAGLLPNAR
ncbi:amidase [Terriglobus sp. RCC_193]|uniref:amidase n=1 Tax=Terriglobus sp. RCC_193 TaxID=3239218 RepID=UPI0035240965